MRPLVAVMVLAAACGKPASDQSRVSDSPRTAVALRAEVTSRPDTSVVVNGVALTAETIRQLHQIYPVPIAPGRYWYDRVSGGYGHEGAPIAGQMLSGLSLGGTLAATASRGTSGVFINQRQLTNGEKLYIERLCQTPVARGRYWVMANGLGGFEGQPASFNLALCPGAQQSRSGSQSSSRTYCDANGACTTTGILGSITTARY